jgi:hypothetical protein
MLPKRHTKELFCWLFRQTTHAHTPRGEVDSRSGLVTLYAGGQIPRPWRPPDRRARTRLPAGCARRT